MTNETLKEQAQQGHKIHVGLVESTQQANDYLVSLLEQHTQILHELKQNPLYFVFDEDTKENRKEIEVLLYTRAFADCDQEHHSQQCWMNGTLFECTGTFEYEIHRREWYIEHSRYVWKEVFDVNEK